MRQKGVDYNIQSHFHYFSITFSSSNGGKRDRRVSKVEKVDLEEKMEAARFEG